jgi:hypothetical protein
MNQRTADPNDACALAGTHQIEVAYSWKDINRLEITE